MPASSVPIALDARPFHVTFRGTPRAGDGQIRIDTPWLGGATAETVFDGVTPSGIEHGIRLYRSRGLLLGCAEIPFVAESLSAHTQALYARLLAAAQGWHLYRIWNYLPAINAVTAGLENYRAFCQGRSRAFEVAFGRDFQGRLPAASAVGSQGGAVTVIFAAGKTAPRHIENPEQVPAYLYPPEHGPRAPSFARATVVSDADRLWTFISGTAAIKGHHTVAPGTFDAQLACTLDNLRLIARAGGLSAELDAPRQLRRHFKIYLRHAADLDVARHELERSLVRPDDVVTYLHADICRAALNIEIEATLVSRA